LDFEHIVWITPGPCSVHPENQKSSFNTTLCIYYIFKLFFSHGTRVALIMAKRHTVSSR
jgi:hypothetical protein